MRKRHVSAAGAARKDVFSVKPCVRGVAAGHLQPATCLYVNNNRRGFPLCTAVTNRLAFMSDPCPCPVGQRICIAVSCGVGLQVKL